MVERALSSAAGERPSADRIGGGMKAHQRPIEAEENWVKSRDVVYDVVV